MPRNGAQSVGLINGSTPSVSSSPTPVGITPSPHALSGGVALRSMTSVERPRSAAWMAIASPAGPPPAIATSTFTAELDLGERHGRLNQLPGEPKNIHRLRRGQFVREEPAQRFASSHLAAGGARQRARSKDSHRMGAHPGAIEHRFADPLLQIARGAAHGPLGENQQLLSFGSFRRETESHHAPRADAIDSVDAALELLRLMVCTPDDDHVLGAPAHVQLAFLDEAQVA